MSSTALENLNVLVFTAHPDDHLCAAGTLMFLADRGFTIHEVVATGGERGTRLDASGKRSTTAEPTALTAERKHEISQAAEIIGIRGVTFLGLPDSEVIRSYALLERLMATIRRERPVLILTMSSKDEHHDHRAMAGIVAEAAERASWDGYPELGAPFRTPILLAMEGMRRIVPQVTIDITPYRKRKQKAIAAYTSQAGPAEERLLEAMNTYHGFFRREPRTEAAEAFEIPSNFPMHLDTLMDIFGATVRRP